jgi:hypothetical protein
MGTGWDIVKVHSTIVDEEDEVKITKYKRGKDRVAYGLSVETGDGEYALFDISLADLKRVVADITTFVNEEEN